MYLLAGSTGLEPAASGVTGRRYNRLNYDPEANLLPLPETTLSCGHIGRQHVLPYFFFLVFTMSFRAFPALNLGEIEAGIVIFFPVCGFWPLRAARATVLKVPKPIRLSLSPFFRQSVTASSKLFSAFSASVFVSSAPAAIVLINSAFVTQYLPISTERNAPKKKPIYSKGPLECQAIFISATRFENLYQ